MSESNVLIRPCAKGDKEILLKILVEVYDESVMRRHELLWDWWQKRSQQASDENHRSMVVLRDGNVVGFTGLQPRTFKIGNNYESGVFVLDTFIHPRARGVGVSLYRHLINVMELMIGAPVERNAVFWKKMTKNENMEVFHIIKSKRIVDVSAFLPNSIRKIFQIPIRVLWSIYELILESRTPQIKGLTFQVIQKYPLGVDSMCKTWASMLKNVPLRDSEFLNWRFTQGPVKYENRLAWQSEQLIGVAAFRVTQMSNRRVLLIVEILAVHKNLVGAYGSMLIEILKFARKNNVSDVQGFDSGCASLHDAYQKSGFIFRQEKSSLLGQYHHDNSPTCPMFQVKDWFISPADSDFEFCYFNQGIDCLEAKIV